MNDDDQPKPGHVRPVWVVRDDEIPRPTLALTLSDGSADTFNVGRALEAAGAPTWVMAYLMFAIATHGEQPELTPAETEQLATGLAPALRAAAQH